MELEILERKHVMTQTENSKQITRHRGEEFIERETPRKEDVGQRGEIEPSQNWGPWRRGKTTPQKPIGDVKLQEAPGARSL